MYVLGIESSCDETGIAIYDTNQQGLRGLIAQQIYSQTALHTAYGGVVPELASRDHVRKVLPLVRQTLIQARCALSDIGGIAYTAGPGLAGALLVGASFARSLAWALGVPAMAVHHMEGHLLAPMMAEASLTPPCVALLVSGGHTQLVWVQAIGRYRILGQTLDDAAGEAFDKTATLLGLPYPGGPSLANLAETGQTGRYVFTRPLIDRPGLEMSFSGLKTQVSTAWRNSDQSQQTKADIARGFEDAVVDTLRIKCLRALDSVGCQTLIVAGGVGANQRLRAVLQTTLAKHHCAVYFPPAELCTDNGAMIAYAGAQRLLADQNSDAHIHVMPRWDIETLPAISPNHTPKC